MAGGKGDVPNQESALAGQLATEAFRVTAMGSAGQVERIYLTIFAANSSYMVMLPRHGEAMIGRDPGSEVHLDDQAVSRQHAVVLLDDGRATVRDLGSHNGTYVNGQRVEGEAVLANGGVVTVSGTQLVFHGPAAAPRSHPIDLARFSAELDAEIARARALERSVAVVMVRAGRPDEWLADSVTAELGGIDRVAATGDDELAVLIAEVDAQDIERAARRLVDAVASSTGSARAGYAAFPAHGDDAQSLLNAARSALAEASADAVMPATARYRTLELGQRSMIVADEAMAQHIELLERLAAVDIPVLVLGETGTGKELAAAAVHHFSPRREGPFMPFNCAAIQESLAESELFGHEKGAFSGATASRSGLFESAEGGTLFLDEVGELPPLIQAKLLRVLENRMITRVGSTTERAIDVRLVAATNRDLTAEVEAGRFRRDLFFRLSAATLCLPPLRDRPREIPLLAQSFLEAARTAAKRDPASLTTEALRCLAAYPWPGNIRELKNSMDFLAAASKDNAIDAGLVEWYLQRNLAQGSPDDRKGPNVPAPDAPPSVSSLRPIKEEIRELECRRMGEALEASRGNQTLAAALIEMPLRTFVAKLKQYGIDVKK